MNSIELMNENSSSTKSYSNEQTTSQFSELKVPKMVDKIEETNNDFRMNILEQLTSTD